MRGRSRVVRVGNVWWGITLEAAFLGIDHGVMPDYDLVVGREMKIKLERRNAEIERGFERWQRVFGFETAGSAVSLYIDTGQWLLDERVFGVRAQNAVVCRAR